MSNLPQRKKTPEEIAKIRESMGLGGPAPAVPPPSALPADQAAPIPDSPAPVTAAEREVAPEPVTAPPVAAIPAAPVPLRSAPGPMPEMPSAEPRPPVEPKQVRSLRKSERGPAPALKAQPAPSTAATHLPSHRRTDFEINQLRRTQAFSAQPPGTHIIAEMVSPLVAGIGYFCVFTAAALPFIDRYLTEVSRYIPAVLCVIGLGFAGFIFLKKKRSLHHAGFIAAIAIFTLIFGALYYLPHLRNAP